MGGEGMAPCCLVVGRIVALACFPRKMIPKLVQKCHHLQWLHEENPIKALHIEVLDDHKIVDQSMLDDDITKSFSRKSLFFVEFSSGLGLA
ncbi:hypothetical protein VNO80_13830 [Phaseolus coccineus]|uniref:Uncharacterized protein n=1 Tax=Phaseolus coccineus TaxID=3886 RepID=A0AAN9N1P8_PHACN